MINESTVYPGATEEFCVPILERESGLRFNERFVCGYSPERINPSDTEHKLTTITKVTSGSTAAAADWVDGLYGSIIKAGTLDMLEAAGTKWNFLPFRPGLVDGHCNALREKPCGYSVDPYYLTHMAEQLGYHPEVVLAGRRINDGMGRWLVEQLVLAMARRGQVIGGTEVLVLGLTFKENCPDLRNTRVVDVIKALQAYDMKATVVDPWVSAEEARREYGLTVHEQIPKVRRYRTVIAPLAHRQFFRFNEQQWRQLVERYEVLVDLKGIVPRCVGAIRL